MSNPQGGDSVSALSVIKMNFYKPISKRMINDMEVKLKKVTCPNYGEIEDLSTYIINPEEHSPYGDIRWVCNHCKIMFTHFGCTLRDPYHRPMGIPFINSGECPYYSIIQPIMFPKQRITIEGDKPPYTIRTSTVLETRNPPSFLEETDSC